MAEQFPAGGPTPEVNEKTVEFRGEKLIEKEYLGLVSLVEQINADYASQREEHGKDEPKDGFII